MTAFVAEVASPLGWARASAGPPPSSGPWPGFSVPASEIPTALGRSPLVGGEAEQAYIPASPPGVIGAAVIRAARRSAGLSRRRLAQMLSMSHETVRAWEEGTTPLFCVPYDQLRALANALTEAGARVGRELDELLLASQCDLLVTGMLHGFEDYADVPPIDEESATGETARDLIRWALTGLVSERYRRDGSAHPLLARPDVIRLIKIAANLRAGSCGLDLVGYGAALAALVERRIVPPVPSDHTTD